VRLALVSVLAALAAPALAGDGVLEINQTCAVKTGCFSGDTAGFPVTISAAGSYLLTSNLVVPDENKSGLPFASSTVSNVSIDLGAFEIHGPVVCSGTPLSCVPSSGTRNGVERVALENRELEAGEPGGFAPGLPFLNASRGELVRPSSSATTKG
jgi:hypothetical protein